MFYGIIKRKLFSYVGDTVLKKVKVRFKKNFHKEEKIKIAPLYPKSKVDTSNRNKKYVSMLNNVIEETKKDKEHSNIAITGSYGTGKSTIIETFISNKKLKSNKDYIKLSLGTYFKTDENNNDGIIDFNEEIKVEYVESNIVRQLLYRNSSYSINEGSFKRIKGQYKNKLHIMFIETFIILFILTIFTKKYYPNIISNMLTYLNDFLIYLTKNITKNETLSYFIFLVLISLIIGIILYFPIKYLIGKINNISFNFKDKTIFSLSDLNEPFAKELKEIIIFFSYNKKCKYVFFEDLDRFGNDISLKIIEDLKGLNKIINDSKVVKQQVFFIYLLKEDIFKKYEDKNKFYDFIISVVPYTTRSNTKEIFDEILSDSKITDEISNNIKYIITKYIDDYRTLISITNDYKIFSSIIHTEKDKLSNCKFLAIATIKNFMLEEYSKILNNENNIINKKYNEEKKNIEKEMIGDINNKIETINDQITKINDSGKLSKKQLKKDLLYYNMTYHNSVVRELNINNNNISIDNFLDDSFDLDLLKYEIDVYYRNGYKYPLSFEKETKEIFIDKVKNINVDVLEKLNNEKKELLRMKSEIQEKSIQELYEYKIKKYENHDILDEFIAAGYIDTDYLNFMTSPFGMLTPSENNYIFNANQGKYNFTIQITNNNIDDICKLLQDKLSNANILNIHLMNFMVTKEETNEYLIKLLQQFNYINNLEYKEENKIRIDFLNEYLRYNFNNKISFTKSFIIKLYDEKIQVKLWDLLENYEKQDEIQNVKNLFYRSSLEIQNEFHDLINNIHYQMYINEFLTYIKNSHDFNEYMQSPTVRYNILEINKNERVRFDDISGLNNNNQEYIINNSLYKYNKNNLIQILIDIPKNIGDLDNKYKYVPIFKENLEKELELFIDEYYLNNDIYLGRKIIIENINNINSMPKEKIEEIFKRENFELLEENITNNNIEFALRYSHVKLGWILLDKYKNEINDITLSNYVSKNEYLLTDKNIKMIHSNSKYSTLLYNLMCNSKLEIAKYILKNNIATDRKYFKSELNNCCKDKTEFELLIQYNKVAFNKQILLLLSNHKVNNIDIYLLNWYKEESLSSLLNAIDNNIILLKTILKNKKINNFDKLTILKNIKVNNDDFNNLFRETFKSKKEWNINTNKEMAQSSYNFILNKAKQLNIIENYNNKKIIYFKIK